MEFLKDTLMYKIRGIRKQILTAAKQSLADSNLTLELYVALHFAYENQGLSQKELADLVWSDANVVVRMIDRLEKLELIRREPNPNDRRAFSLFVTEKGEEVCHKYWKDLQKYQEETLSHLSAEERQNFKRYLDIVLEGTNQ